MQQLYRTTMEMVQSPRDSSPTQLESPAGVQRERPEGAAAHPAVRRGRRRWRHRRLRELQADEPTVTSPDIAGEPLAYLRDAARPAAERRAAQGSRLSGRALAPAAFHPGLRHGAQHRHVHRGQARPDLAGADAAAQRGRLLPDLRPAAAHQPRHPELSGLPGHRRVRVQLHPAGLHHHFLGNH